MRRVVHHTGISLILLAGLVIAISVMFVSRADAAGVSPVHLYNLNGNLNGNLDDSLGGVPLTDDGGSLTLVPGRYTFGGNQGLRLSGGLADPES